MIAAKINGHPVQALLDSAAEATIVDKVWAIKSNGRFFGSALEIAGRRFTNVEAAIDANPSASDVNVGVSVLRHFQITTDFANHAVWLRPRK